MFQALFRRSIVRSVDFNVLRHNDRRCYVASGFGGRPLEYWPVYGFFEKYLEGRQAQAADAFATWYGDQFDQYRHTAKTEGGMYRGSLYRLIEQVHQEHGLASDGELSRTDPMLVRQAIELRVQQRFALLESIVSTGYQVALDDPIHAVSERGLVYLTGGHHRCAILRLIGNSLAPSIRVFRNERNYQRARRKGAA